MITTKTGDTGKTNCGGRRVDKDDILVETIGEIDELQAVLCLTGSQISDFRFQIDKIVKDLGVIMGKLGGVDSGFMIQESRIKQFEEEIGENKIHLDKFVVFKTKKARELNWARTICRRVERKIVGLNRRQKIDENILKYFNRLSDYLFIKALEKNKK